MPTSRKRNSKRPLTKVERADLAVARLLALDPDRLPGKLVSRFAEIGDQPPLATISVATAVVGALRRDERLFRTGLRMLSALTLSTMAKTIGKGTIDRTRPAEVLENGRYKLQEGDSKDADLRSMPSGHSAGVTAVMLAATYDYPKQVLPAAAVAGAVMGAQLPSRNHFLSDIAAGAALGLLTGALSRMLVPSHAELKREELRESGAVDA